MGRRTAATGGTQFQTFSVWFFFSVCLWAAAETCAEEVVHRSSKGRSDSRDKGCDFEAVLFLVLCSAEEAIPFEDGPVVVFQFNTFTSEAFNDTVQSRILEEKC